MYRVDSNPCRTAFLLIDNFTFLALASAIEPLRMANQLTGETLYDWKLVTRDGNAVSASDGIRVIPDGGLPDVNDFDLVVVVAGNDVAALATSAEMNWLRQAAKRRITLGALCTGAYVLAKAGLLDGYDCSAHWECLPALQEHFPRVRCNRQLFTFDRDRITCTGGSVPLHLMLTLIADQHGRQLANGVSDMFICDRIRENSEPQRLRMDSQRYANQPKLAEAVQLMEANIEEPIELEDVARYARVSRRHLERLFLTHLDATPSRFYLKLRLERARQLLQQTSCPIVEIAGMCGFASATHFSRSYRRYMGKPPRAERFVGAAVSEISPLQAAQHEASATPVVLPAAR